MPLTAFNDSRRKGSIRTITDRDFQPYQYAVVQLRDGKGNPVKTLREARRIFRHRTGRHFELLCLPFRARDLPRYFRAPQESACWIPRMLYWAKHYPDVTAYIRRLTATMINVLELHDRRHETTFLGNIIPRRRQTGWAGWVGQLHRLSRRQHFGQSPIPAARDDRLSAVRARPLTEAVHSVHARFVPMPDKAGRTQNCQACHPSHWQNEKMNDVRANPYQVTDDRGKPAVFECGRADFRAAAAT